MQNNLRTRVKCTGLNLTKLINLCVSKNIEINDLVRTSYNEMTFSLNDENMGKLKGVDTTAYEIKVKKLGGLKKILNTIFIRMGLCIGLILGLLFVIFTQNRLFHIEIYGVDVHKKEEIILSLHELGLKKFSYMKFDNFGVEEYLQQTHNFSLVSVKVKGNTLLVSVKSELPDIAMDYTPIISEYNMVITDIVVYAGTSQLKIGDIVYVGDRLVEPYITENDEKIDIKPCAEIYGTTFVSDKYEFHTISKQKVCTGKKKIIETSYFLGKHKVVSNVATNRFEMSEVQESRQALSHYFLPIEVSKKVAFEQVWQETTRDFDKEKETIVADVKSQAYAKVPKNLVVDDEDVQISSTKYGYIVTVYLKIGVYLNKR